MVGDGQGVLDRAGVPVTLHLYLSGRAWAAQLGDTGAGVAGETHADAEDWPGQYTPAGRWLCAAVAACTEAEARGYQPALIVCYGISGPLRVMIRSQVVGWPADLARWRDDLIRRAVPMDAAKVRSGEMERIRRLVRDAPANDAIFTGISGLGAVGWTGLMVG